ncbi:hypothetical protein B0H16DRAFT_249169 [Mycena metata]|uniref:Uncharacterized protein n=1 Tax=Mycena metata TaxID=1033252 RepID=A0AAD7HUR2_9AGAR|nr:hypothetical protein B0H16DRAFT_249169 [Mycena metata]
MSTHLHVPALAYAVPLHDATHVGSACTLSPRVHAYVESARAALRRGSPLRPLSLRPHCPLDSRPRPRPRPCARRHVPAHAPTPAPTRSVSPCPSPPRTPRPSTCRARPVRTLVVRAPVKYEPVSRGIWRGRGLRVTTAPAAPATPASASASPCAAASSSSWSFVGELSTRRSRRRSMTSPP